MSGIQQYLSSLADERIIFSAFVFLAVFTAVLLLGQRMFSMSAAPRDARSAADMMPRSSKPVLLNGRPLASSSGEHDRPMEAGGLRPDALLSAKRVLRKVFRALSAVVIAALLALTFLSYRQSTPGTGDILLTIILAAVTLMTAVHLLRIDRKHKPDPDPGLQEGFDGSVRTGIATRIQEALSGAVTVEWKIASPEVQRMDNADLARARAMSQEGKSIDEICRALNGDYAGWSPPHQQAFRNIMQAALDHS